MYADGVWVERVAEINFEGERVHPEIYTEPNEYGEMMWMEFDADVEYREYDCGVKLEHPLRTAVLRNMEVRNANIGVSNEDSEDKSDRFGVD